MDPLEELNKASRSVRVSIHNTSSKKLILKSHPLTSGQWRVPPPETILPLGKVEFGSESGMMGGIEAGAVYSVDSSKESVGQFEFFWNNPMFGKKGYRKVSPAGFDTDCSIVDNNHFVIRLTIKEIDTGMKDIEDIEKEIKDLVTFMIEADSAIKGMNKICQVYQVQNDLKQVKLVEGNIKEKTTHLEAMRAKKEQLEGEIANLRQVENDPKLMEQTLSKIRESIEALVKARKGMEHMREVYEKQKDTKSMQALDNQIEVKKNEIDLLRKREQKVIQKVIELKKSLGIGNTIAPAQKKRVKALYDYNKSTEDELTIKTGDIIEVAQDDNPDWIGGTLNGHMGFFPRAFVVPLEEEAPPASVSDAVPTQEDFTDLYPKARVIYDHAAADEGEITLTVGDIISVFSWEDEYWWEGYHNDKSGYFPCNCVEWVDESQDNYDYSDYAYYESTGDDSANTTPVATPPVAATPVVAPAPVVVTPTPAPVVVTPTPTPTPTLPTAPIVSTPTKTGTFTAAKPVSTPTPTPTPVSTQPTTNNLVHQAPTIPAKRELPTPTKTTPTTTTAPHNATHGAPLKAPTHILATPAPTTPTTPVVSTPSTPSTPTPTIPSTSAPTTNNVNFEKLIQPLLTELTKNLVEAHQKETSSLHQKISELEKEIKELNNKLSQQQKSSPTITSTASVVSKATPISNTRKF
eukprot:gene9900-12143_t